MAKTRVKLNHAGFRELLTSAKVDADLRRRAERIADAADGEVLVNERRHGRAGVTVTANDSAKLLGALDRGRG